MKGPSLGVADVVRSFEGALLAARGDQVTSAQRRVLRDIAVCRTPVLGGHVYRCDACGGESYAYNSCRNRHCPSCLAYRSADWLDARRKELLPVEYFHVVFTVPEAVAQLALGNKRVIYAIIFAAAAATLQKIAGDPRHLGAEIGILAVLHTWSQTLIHHPHVHCVVTGGGLSADGGWISCRPGFFLPVRVLSRMYRGKFIARLEKARTKGDLLYRGATAELASDSGWRRFIRRLWKNEWVVYAKAPFGSPDQVLKYLARYTHRVAISDRRIVNISKPTVEFRYRDRARDNKIGTMVLEGVEFLRRFLLHVLPKGFTRIRHYGLLANRCREAKLAKCRRLLGPEEVEVQRPVDEQLELNEHTKSDGASPAETDGATKRTCPYCGASGLVHLGILRPTSSTAKEEDAMSPDTS